MSFAHHELASKMKNILAQDLDPHVGQCLPFPLEPKRKTGVNVPFLDWAPTAWPIKLHSLGVRADSVLD